VGVVALLPQDSDPTPRRVVVPFQEAGDAPETTTTSTTSPPVPEEVLPVPTTGSPTVVEYDARNYPQSPPQPQLPTIEDIPTAPDVAVISGPVAEEPAAVEDPSPPEPTPTTCVPRPGMPGTPVEYYCG